MSERQQLTEQDIELCYELVRTQTDAPQGCAPEFVSQCEDLRHKLVSTLDRFDSLYEQVGALGGYPKMLKAWNPTEAQLAGLVAGMKKLVGKSDAQLWNDGE